MTPPTKAAVTLAQPESPLLSLPSPVPAPPHTPNFDPVARPYRWLEYATLGPLLEQTRQTHLPAMTHTHQALILGDGDGRFTAKLLAINRQVHAEAIDLSTSMLTLLRRRTAPYTSRLITLKADARTHLPQTPPDLITTHFFLDCLTQPEVESLIHRLTPTLAPNCLWAISEFRIPPGPAHLAARLYIRTLYLAFRILTGLRVQSLPDHATPLRRAGFTLLAERHRLFGLLTAQLWRLKNNP